MSLLLLFVQCQYILVFKVILGVLVLCVSNIGSNYSVFAPRPLKLMNSITAFEIILRFRITVVFCFPKHTCNVHNRNFSVLSKLSEILFKQPAISLKSAFVVEGAALQSAKNKCVFWDALYNATVICYDCIWGKGQIHEPECRARWVEVCTSLTVIYRRMLCQAAYLKYTWTSEWLQCCELSRIWVSF